MAAVSFGGKILLFGGISCRLMNAYNEEGKFKKKLNEQRAKHPGSQLRGSVIT